MADSPPVTRKRGRHNDGDRAVTRERRNGGGDWRESLRNTRHEENMQEKAVADKRKKLLRAIPSTIPGVSAVVRGDARSDIREIEGLVDMQVLEPDAVAPGAVQATPRPPMPKANQPDAKRSRIERWKKDPSEMEKDMAKQRESLARAEEEDAQLEAEHDAWERWYLVLRAHLTADRRPAATWSPAAAAAALASSANTSSESPVSAGAGGESDSSEENESAANAAATTADADAVSAAGGTQGGGGSGTNGSGAGGDANGNGKVDRRGGADGGFLAARGGEEEEEEERLRELQALVMKRAGLKGEFDMNKVLNVLAACSHDAMTARREHVALVAKQEAGGGKADLGRKASPAEPDKGKDKGKDNGDVHPHPEDEDSLRRWEELLRSVDVSGGRWRSDVVDGGFLDPVGGDHDRDDMDVAGSTGTSRRARQQQNDDLLVPRGLDLLPSMRAPRRLPPATATSMSNGVVAGDGGDDGDGSGSGNGSGGAKAAEAKETADGARATEYVPWIGGSSSFAGLKPGKTGMAAAAAAAPVPAASNRLQDRVRWFPRGLPMEPTAAGDKGQDERESVIFNTRASMAIDRLGEQVGETAKRQAEMEIKRREKVEEAVRLVRAAADHEKLRQEHLRRMKTLRARLESLEGTKGLSSSSPNGQASADEQDVDQDQDQDKEEQEQEQDAKESGRGKGEAGGGSDNDDDDDDDDDNDNDNASDDSEPVDTTQPAATGTGTVSNDASNNDNDGDGGGSDGDSDVPVLQSVNGGGAAGGSSEGDGDAADSDGGKSGESKPAPPSAESDSDEAVEADVADDNGDASKNASKDTSKYASKAMSEESNTEAGGGGGGGRGGGGGGEEETPVVGAKKRGSTKSDNADVDARGADDGPGQAEGGGGKGGGGGGIVGTKRRGPRGSEGESAAGGGGGGGSGGVVGSRPKRRRSSADAAISAAGNNSRDAGHLAANGEGASEERSSPRAAAAAAAAAAAESRTKSGRAGVGKRANTSRLGSRGRSARR